MMKDSEDESKSKNKNEAAAAAAVTTTRERGPPPPPYFYPYPPYAPAVNGKFPTPPPPPLPLPLPPAQAPTNSRKNAPGVPPPQHYPYPYPPPPYGYMLVPIPPSHASYTEAMRQLPPPTLTLTATATTANAAGKKKGTKTTAPTSATSTNKRKAPPAAAVGGAATKKRSQPTKNKTAAPAKPAPRTKTPPAKKAPPAKKPAAPTASAIRSSIASSPPVLTPPREGVSWETRYEQLVHWQQGHGHCRVPVRYNGTPGLGSWASRQRQMYRYDATEGITDPGMAEQTRERIDKLNKIGFVWTIKEPPPPWEARFEELEAFKKEHGHVRVRRSHVLGEWVHNQRKEYKTKKGKLATPERVMKLLELGFEFVLQLKSGGCVSWETRLEQLMDFRRKYGHCNVFAVSRQHIKDTGLKDITIASKSPGINGDGMSNLQNIDDDDTDNDDEDDEDANDDGDNATDGTTDSSNVVENVLLRWVERQQRSYWTQWKLGKACRLTKPRVKKLQEMGFDFGPERQPRAKGANKGPSHHRTDAGTYNERMEQLRVYKAQKGNCLVPREWPENPQLGSWVASQRRQYRALLDGRSSSLTTERRVELESLDFVWVVRPWNLKENRKRKDDSQNENDDSSSGEGSE